MPGLVCENECKSDVLIGIGSIGRIGDFAILPLLGKEIILIFEVIICPVKKAIKSGLILEVDCLQKAIGHTL